MRIETSRLILRDIVADDLEALCAYRQKPEFYKHLPQEITQNDVIRFIEKAVTLNTQMSRRYFYLAITLRDGSVIGDIVLHADKEIGRVGFGLDPAFWGRGLITEALNAVISFASDTLELQRIETGADVANSGSWRALEKCGFKRLFEQNGLYEYAWTHAQ